MLFPLMKKTEEENQEFCLGHAMFWILVEQPSRNVCYAVGYTGLRFVREI